jgi:hypothetical protein
MKTNNNNSSEIENHFAQGSVVALIPWASLQWRTQETKTN